MSERILYHGSSVAVYQPKILSNGFFKDFGYGFYCTDLEKQARRWALTKRRRHVVSVYSYAESPELNICRFPEMNEEWLSFIVDCRRGISHAYDIVEGAMANDTIWNFVEDYARGEISKAAFWELIRFRHPTHQIVFASEQALQTLHFERSYEL